MISLVIHTVDGRRHVWKDVYEGWYDTITLENPTTFIRCSQCEAYNNRESAFCPDCGAQMRGGEQDGV